MLRDKIFASAVSPTWAQQAKLVASDAQTNDFFGSAVAISADGSTVVVGAPYEDPSGISAAGSAYVFVRSGTTWAQQAKLTVAGASSDFFGDSVAISDDGDTVVIGAPNDDVGGTVDAGSAYVFVRSGTTWTQQAWLYASDRAASDLFGSSVAITSDGNKVVIGAPNDDISTVLDAGSAYIFTRSGTTWTQASKETATGYQAQDLCGTSVAVSRDGLVDLYGVRGEDPGSISNAGTGHTIVRIGGVVYRITISASDKAAGDQFGMSVSLNSDGTTALVGAYTADPGGLFNAGAAYVFTRISTTWTQQAKLVASDSEADAFFGVRTSLSGDGDIAVVGALQDDGGGISNAGAVYIFTRSGTTWSEDAKLISPSAQSGGQFGYSVSMSRDGSTLAVGANKEDPDGMADAGCVYIFTA